MRTLVTLAECLGFTTAAAILMDMADPATRSTQILILVVCVVTLILSAVTLYAMRNDRSLAITLVREGIEAVVANTAATREATDEQKQLQGLIGSTVLAQKQTGDSCFKQVAALVAAVDAMHAREKEDSGIQAAIDAAKAVPKPPGGLPS